MTIVKAKELLQQDLDDPGSVDISDLNKAQELGIEALKDKLEQRKTAFLGRYTLLPGETKE